MAGELISFGLGANWIAKLWSTLRSIQKKRKQELDEINRIMFGNPLELAKYYVEPRCQETNPADRHEEDFLVSREPIMVKIDQFFRSKTPPHPGSNQMFILSDAGMGKSSLLIMLKLLHLTSFWPKGKDCVVKKLGEKTIEEINQIGNQMDTILLLDSLDEDPCAYGQVKDRLMEILVNTQNFHRVIITCRTQFFPDTKDDPLERPGLVTIEGYICPTKYMAFFDESQVAAYLRKRFPKKFGLFPQKKILKAAQAIITRMGTLRARPMLLAYIEDLMSSPSISSSESEFNIYKVLVTSWLLREQAKSKLPSELLFRACEILAGELTINHKRSISSKEIDLLIARTPEMGSIKSLDIKGRSLLNRNSAGEYRFSHFTFQEFLVAHRLINDQTWEPEKPIPLSDVLKKFIFERVHRRNPKPRLRLLDLKDADLTNIMAYGEDFSNANFYGNDLRGAKLSYADLTNASISNVKLDHANLRGADLSDVNFTDVSLFATNLRDANLSGASFNRCTYVPEDVKWNSVHNIMLNMSSNWSPMIRASLKDFVHHPLLKTYQGASVDNIVIKIGDAVDFRIAQAVIAACVRYVENVFPIIDRVESTLIIVGDTGFNVEHSNLLTTGTWITADYLIGVWGGNSEHYFKIYIDGNRSLLDARHRS